MYQFVNHFSTKKSYVYFTIPHSSYYQLLFNTNTTIYLHNFPPLSLILYFFPFIFFPCYYSLPPTHNALTYPSFQNHSYNNLNKHLRIFISHHHHPILVPHSPQTRMNIPTLLQKRGDAQNFPR